MKTIEDINKIKADVLNKANLDENRKGKRIVVGMATCGIAAGAKPVFKAFEKGIKEAGIKNCTVCKTGCVGACRLEPMVEIYEGNKRVTYVHMDVEKAEEVIANHLCKGKVVTDYTIGAQEGETE